MKTIEAQIAELRDELAEINAELNSDKEIREYREKRLRNNRRLIRDEIARLEAIKATE